MSLITIPVFLSGEEAEETLEELIPDSRDFIHEHEEAAEKAIWLMATLGISSLISLLALYKSLNASNIIHLMSLIIAVITFIMFMRVANLGGEIRHSEIRQSTVPVEGAILESQERHDDNDDD